MASGNGRFDSDEPFFESETPQFFKVMSGTMLERGKIAIPPKFIYEYGHHLSESVLLKPPSGRNFRVQIEEFKGKVWLGNGLRKFQGYFYLVEGSMVLFELADVNVFHVLIFGVNCVEIDYPMTLNYPDPASESECSRHGERDKRPTKAAKRNGKRQRYQKLELPPSSHRALKAAERFQFQSEAPNFLVRLRPSYMRSGGMSIKAKFMKENKFKPGQDYVTLKHGGRSWPVNMLCYQNEHRGKLCAGLGVFLADNHLRNGDVCVFVLKKKYEFDVHFFRCRSHV